MASRRRLPHHIKNRLRRLAIENELLGRGRIRLHWHDIDNFGDQLSPFIVEQVTGRESIWVPRNWSGKTLAVGSIAAHQRDGDTIFGAGFISDTQVEIAEQVEILALRGPLTLRCLQGADCSVFGDPAMLLPHFYTPTPPQTRWPVGIVPHYVDFDEVAAYVDDPSVRVVDVRENWRRVVDAICACEVIVSSSLHGIIVAEAYGLPAIWISVSDEIIGGNFKFHDYLLGTGRDVSYPVTLDTAMRTVDTASLAGPKWDGARLLEAGRSLRMLDA